MKTQQPLPETSPDKHVSKIQHDLYMFRFQQMEKIRANLGDNYNKLSDLLPMVADGRLPLSDAQDVIDFVFTDLDKGIYDFGMFAEAAAVALQMMKEKIVKEVQEKEELLEDLANPYLAKHPAVLGLLSRWREDLNQELMRHLGPQYVEFLEEARELGEEYLGHPDAIRVHFLDVEG